MKGDLLPYKVIGDIAYLMKLSFYFPFKDEKDELLRIKVH